MPIASNQTVTVVISRAIRAGRERDFDRWVEKLSRLAQTAPGYRAAIRLGQTAGFQHLLYRFDDQVSAETWQADEAYKAHVDIADGFSTALVQLASGDNVTFELPSDASASTWKRFVATWIAVFPLLLVISSIVREILKDVPPIIQLLPSSLILTATLQWLILPRLQRHTRFWLLKDQSGDLQN